MASDPRITQYVRQQMDAGFRRQQVYDALLEAGWYREEVEQAFYEVANQKYGTVPVPAAEKVVQEAERKAPHSHKKALAALIILVAIVIVVFVVPVLLPGTFLDVLNLGMLNPLLLFMGGNKAVTGFGELGIPSSWQYKYDGSFSVVLRNGLGVPVTINSVTANCGTEGSAVVLETLDPMHLESGGGITYSTGDEKCSLKEPGESYSVSVDVRYLQEDNMLKTASGTVTGRIS